MKNTIVFLLLIATTVSCQNYGKKIVFNGTEVYYKDGVTKEQATQLGEYLINNEFATGNRKSVQFLINDITKNLTFRMVVDQKTADKATVNNYIFTTFSRELSTEFKKPVDFVLCNNKFETLKTYLNKDVPKIINALKTQIHYTKNVSINATQLLANYLINSEFADDKVNKTIEFDKRDDTYLFRVVVYEGAEKSQANVTLLASFAKELSKDVFNNQPVELHMCDNLLKTLKVVK